MDDQRHTRARVHARDAGLRRLKVATAALTIGTAALAGIFTGLAASASGGKKVVVRTVRPVAPRVQRPATGRIPPPPQLPALASNDAPSPAAAKPQSQPQAPPQAPTPTPQPPVAVSGGS